MNKEQEAKVDNLIETFEGYAESRAAWRSAMGQRNEEILRLVAQHVTYEEIAARFGITRQRVGQIVEAHKKAVQGE